MKNQHVLNCSWPTRRFLLLLLLLLQPDRFMIKIPKAIIEKVGGPKANQSLHLLENLKKVVASVAICFALDKFGEAI